MMIVLRHGKFISSGRISKSGDVLPDNEFSRTLVAKGYAEIVSDNPPSKPPAKKSKTEPPRENDTVNP